MTIYSKAQISARGSALIEFLWACIVLTAVLLIGARLTVITLQAMAQAAGWV